MLASTRAMSSRESAISGPSGRPQIELPGILVAVEPGIAALPEHALVDQLEPAAAFATEEVDAQSVGAGELLARIDPGVDDQVHAARGTRQPTMMLSRVMQSSGSAEPSRCTSTSTPGLSPPTRSRCPHWGRRSGTRARGRSRPWPGAAVELVGGRERGVAGVEPRKLVDHDPTVDGAFGLARGRQVAGAVTIAIAGGLPVAVIVTIAATARLPGRRRGQAGRGATRRDRAGHREWRRSSV
jgi:hypothetical protein